MAKYCGITLFEVFELEVYDFYFLLRDSIIYSYSQSEEGEKYLNDAWRLEQTEGDMDTLRNTFGKEKTNGR